MNVKNIGSPNSIARYCANTSFGGNEYAVFEYISGMPVVRAAGTKAHCEKFMKIGRHLINVRSYAAIDLGTGPDSDDDRFLPHTY